MTRNIFLPPPPSHHVSSALAGNEKQAQGLAEALSVAKRSTLQLQEEASALRADGERLRFERDRLAATVRHLEEEAGRLKGDLSEMVMGSVTDCLWMLNMSVFPDLFGW